MYDIVTCMYEKDPIKTAEKNGNSFSAYKSMTDAKRQLTPQSMVE